MRKKALTFLEAQRKGIMNDDSDVDFIIKFPDDMNVVTYSDNYFAFAKAIGILLHRKVELITERTLKNPFLLYEINLHKLRLI